MDPLITLPPTPAAGASDQPDRSPSNRSFLVPSAPRPGTLQSQAWPAGAVFEAGFTAGPSIPPAGRAGGEV